MRCSVLILILLYFVSCSQKDDTPSVIELNKNWQFKKVSDTIWQQATVPGNVFSDLFENEMIPNPFIGANEAEVQWVSETDWEYRTTFQVDEQMLRRKRSELNFDGLDTYASVFLNDSLILKSNNAFSQFSVDVKPFLKVKNTLSILFKKPSIYEEIAKTQLPYNLPESNRIFTRKAQFQYGWDWGPKLNTIGIWRPIKLTAWNDYKIEDVYIQQFDLNKDHAHLGIFFDEETEFDKDLTYNVYVNDSLYLSKQLNPFLKFDYHNASYIPITLENPIRWWPHNLGEPYLYDIKLVVKDDERTLDSVQLKKGLRTVELVTEKDSLGESFYFKVNEVPVYAKGANYIPQNSLQNKVTKDDYEQLLDDVVAANMNMLRVWGGGIYEEDIFYDLCDEKGILVWQDFMFACAMYPGDKDFLKNVKQEAIDNVKRLRNHASISLWCGNNESSEGWYRWGWQDGRSKAEKEEIWNDYLKVFDSILPQTVQALTDADYWQSSPKYGRGNPQYEFEGDAHDWWVWHDGYPFEHFEKHVPRFMSEFGFQSFPSLQVINYINQKDSLNFYTKGFQNHQKHSRGFELIQDYMTRYFPVPNTPEDYVYLSQLLQAYGITKGIEAQRRAKPYNMGSLFWQLNDCWPSVSWSSIDFFGNWKALHYEARDSYKNFLISSTIEKNIIKTYLVNDSLEGYDGILNIRILDFTGNIIYEDSKELYIEENSSEIKNELDISNLEIDKQNVVIATSFGNNQSYFYLVKPKDLKLQKGEIQFKEVTKIEEGFLIELFSEVLQKDVFISANTDGHFSDNYFDLLPNQPKVITFETFVQELPVLKTKSLNNFIRD